MHHVTAYDAPLSRRRLLRLAGATATTLTGIDLTGRNLIASAASLRRLQDAPSGELTIGYDADAYRIDPPERANIGYYPLNTNIFETLVRLTPEYQIEPLLAESWEFIEPNTYRFTLRQGVTFHDGSPFDAEAVLWSMGRIAQAGGGILFIDENSTKAIDDFTVEITPAQPNRRLLE